MGALAGGERCGIVAADLPQTRAAGCYAVILAHDADVGGAEAGLEVGAHGGDENHEQILARGFHAHLSRDAQLDGADIE